MKKILLISLYLISSACVGQTKQDSLMMKYYKKIILQLADDSMYGRPVGSKYEAIAAELIVSEFKKMKGFHPVVQPFDCHQKDSTTIIHSKNVYCYIDQHADSTILISAHYEHIGMGDGLSYSYGKIGIHNGADDNASGVAMLLGLAKNFKRWAGKNYNYIFVAYSGHEIGLFGSQAFSGFYKDKIKPISLVINMDMVGRFDKDAKVLNVYGVNTLTKYRSYFDTLHFDGKLYDQYSDKIFDTDAKWFALQHISSVSFTTGVHNDYHKITDDEKFINYSGMINVNTVIESFLKKWNVR